MPKDRNHQVFETALKNTKRSNGAWPTQYCDDIDISTMSQFDGEVKKRIRELMEKAKKPDQFLFQLDNYASALRKLARQKLDTGQVAAVDGTDALDRITMMNTSAYAVAVGYITSEKRGDPHIAITTTSTRYIEPMDIDRYGLNELCIELDEAGLDQSWPTTYREYQERRLAMTCETDIVLLDGPVWTQNLMTQTSGRDLYTEMDKSRSAFIGVIKNISGSWTLSKWCGQCVNPGEGFVVGPVRTQLQGRFKSQRGVLDWVDQMPEDYVRVVYRPNQKAFAFECRLSQLELAVALLLEDASPTINHETPVLLELIDAQIRSGFRAHHAAGLVISKIQHGNYQMGVDITNEREYR